MVRFQVGRRHGVRPGRVQEHEAHLARSRVPQAPHLCGSITILHAKGVIMIADILTKLGQARPIFLQLLKLLDDSAKNSILELTT